MTEVERQGCSTCSSVFIVFEGDDGKCPRCERNELREDVRRLKLGSLGTLDYERLHDWVHTSERKAPSQAFTAGILRDVAYAVEMPLREADRLRKDVNAKYWDKCRDDNTALRKTVVKAVKAQERAEDRLHALMKRDAAKRPAEVRLYRDAIRMACGALRTVASFGSPGVEARAVTELQFLYKVLDETIEEGEASDRLERTIRRSAAWKMAAKLYRRRYKRLVEEAGTAWEKVGELEEKHGNAD